MSLQRMLFLLGFLTCVVLIAAALYFQHIEGLEPCPLCVLQRIAVIAVGVVLLIGALHNPKSWGRRVYGFLAALCAGAGVAVAGRNVWLQNLPEDQVPACGPGLDYMLEAFPLAETLSMIFRGSGECAEVQWTLLGLSMPAWMLVIFSVFLVFGLLFLFTRFAQR